MRKVKGFIYFRPYKAKMCCTQSKKISSGRFVGATWRTEFEKLQGFLVVSQLRLAAQKFVCITIYGLLENQGGQQKQTEVSWKTVNKRAEKSFPSWRREVNNYLRKLLHVQKYIICTQTKNVLHICIFKNSRKHEGYSTGKTPQNI